MPLTQIKEKKIPSGDVREKDVWQTRQFFERNHEPSTEKVIYSVYAGNKEIKYTSLLI
jgi:hypothetical protein